MHFRNLTPKVAMFTTLALDFSLAQGQETFTTEPSSTTKNLIIKPSETTSGPLELSQLLAGSSNFGGGWRRDEEEQGVVPHFDLANTLQHFPLHPIVPHYYMEKYDGKIPYIITPEYFEREFGNVRREFSILLTPRQAEKYLGKTSQGTKIIPEKTEISHQYQGPYYYQEKYDGKIPYLFTPAEFKSFFGEEKGTFPILLTLGESRQWLSKYKSKFRNPVYTIDKGGSNEEAALETEKVAVKEPVAEFEAPTVLPATLSSFAPESADNQETEDALNEKLYPTSPPDSNAVQSESTVVHLELPAATDSSTLAPTFSSDSPIGSPDTPLSSLPPSQVPQGDFNTAEENEAPDTHSAISESPTESKTSSDLEKQPSKNLENSSEDENNTLESSEVVKALKELETEGKMTMDIARKILQNSDQLTIGFQSALLEGGGDGIIKGARAVISGWLMFFHLMGKGIIPDIPSFREVGEILGLPKVIEAAGVQSMEVASPAIEKGIEAMFGAASVAGATSAEQAALSVLGAQMSGALGTEEYEAFSAGVADGDPALEATLDQIIDIVQPDLETSHPISGGTNEQVEVLRQNGERLDQLVKNTSSNWLDKFIKYSSLAFGTIGAGAGIGAI